MSMPKEIQNVLEELRRVDAASSNVNPPVVDCSKTVLIKEYINQRKVFEDNLKIESSLQHLAYK